MHEHNLDAQLPKLSSDASFAEPKIGSYSTLCLFFISLSLHGSADQLEYASFLYYSKAATKVVIKFSITHTLQNSHTINNVLSN